MNSVSDESLPLGDPPLIALGGGRGGYEVAERGRNYSSVT